VDKGDYPFKMDYLDYLGGLSSRATQGTNPQAFFGKVVDGLQSDAVASGVSVRFGRSLLVVIVLGVSPEEMKSLMKKIAYQIKLHYQLLK
jgi:hypothetical protein